jgi:hypothetical protein
MIFHTTTVFISQSLLTLTSACMTCTNHDFFFHYAVFLNKYIKTAMGFLKCLVETTPFEVPELIMFHWCRHIMFVAGHKLQDQEFQECVSQIHTLICFMQYNAQFKVTIILTKQSKTCSYNINIHMLKFPKKTRHLHYLGGGLSIWVCFSFAVDVWIADSPLLLNFSHSFTDKLPLAWRHRHVCLVHLKLRNMMEGWQGLPLHQQWTQCYVCLPVCHVWFQPHSASHKGAASNCIYIFLEWASRI